MRLKDEIVEELKRHAAARGLSPEAVIEAALAREIDLHAPALKRQDGAIALPASRGRRHPLD